MKLSPVISAAMFAVASMLPAAARGASFDELHISGAVDVRVVNNVDSAGQVVYDPGAHVNLRKAADALYVTGASDAPSERVVMTVYIAHPLKVLSAAGRARVSCMKLSSPDHLAIVASGASVMRLADVEAANVNISLTGSGSVVIEGALTASNLNLSLTGSGKMNIGGITASRMTVTQRGSGRMVFTGSARDCDAVVYGTGSIDLRNLVAGAMDLKLYGQGKIFYPAGVHVTMSGDGSRIIQVKPYQPL